MNVIHEELTTPDLTRERSVSTVVNFVVSSTTEETVYVPFPTRLLGDKTVYREKNVSPVKVCHRF